MIYPESVLCAITDSDLIAEVQKRINERGALYLKDRKEVNGCIMNRGAYGLLFNGYHPLVDDPGFPPKP